MLLEKVLVISYYWPPSGGAGVQRALKFVRYLGQYGFQPIVLTVDPQKASYPVTDPSLSADLPSGLDVHHTASFEPLNLLSALLGKKNVPYGGFANANKESRTQSMLRWIRGNFFIPDARAGWVPYAFREAVRIIEQQQIKVVFISSPPHSSQLIGLKLKKRFPSLHWVADMRDPWTDIYYYKDLLHTPPAAARDARYEREVLEGAGVVLVVSEAIKRSFLKKSAKLSPDKIKVIPNGYDEHDFQREEQPEAGHFTITYVGTMAELYRPEVFFRVFRSLLTKHPEINLRFRFVGNAPWTLRKMVEDMGLAASCEWIGHVSHADAISYMLRSDALLLIIPDSEGAEGILTGKLFEYLGARRLIIGLGPVEGDAAAILRRCEAGRMFERSSETELFAWLDDKISGRKVGQALYSGNDAIFAYRRSVLTREMALWCRPETKHS